jgi:hypothetical protein
MTTGPKHPDPLGPPVHTTDHRAQERMEGGVTSDL